MNAKKLAIVSVAFAGLLAAAASAEARGRDDVQFSVTIGSPHWSAQPVYGTQPVYRSYDRHYEHSYGHSPTGRDLDGDGIPNRFDRVYNPRWDRDGDGVPNRYDRVYNPRWDRDGDGIPNRFDRVYNPRWDRDGDGVPNRYDGYDNRRFDGRGGSRW